MVDNVMVWQRIEREIEQRVKTRQQRQDHDRNVGRVEALRYVDDWIKSHLSKDYASQAYIAGLEEIRINVQAALQRLQNGEPMESLSTVD